MEKQNDPVKADFRNFLYLTWKFLGLPEPTVRQYEIANYLQEFKRRRIIEGFRGVGKSWITSAYVLWRLHCDPEYKALVVSASKSRSDDFSSFTKRLIKEMPLLQYLQPTHGQRDSMISFDVAPAKASHAPSVKSVGIFGQMTGSRAVEIIADDVEVPNNSYTQDQRDKLIKRCMEFEAIIMPEVGQITYLGTPQTEESIYNKLRERGYERRIWTCRFVDESVHHKYNGDLAPTIVEEARDNPELLGHTTDPQRFSDIDLSEREISYGKAGFALQFMLDTSLSDAERYPLKLADLIVMDVDREEAPITINWTAQRDFQHLDLANVGFSGDRFYKPLRMNTTWKAYQGITMSVDISGRGADEMAYAIIAQLFGYLYVLDFDGLQGGYDEENLVKLAKLAKEYKVNTIVLEDNFGDGMFTALFTPVLLKHYRCSVEEVKQHQQKEKRLIETLEPVMARHRLILDKKAVKRDINNTYKMDNNVYSLFYQMTRLQNQRGALRHDDRLDALAIGVKWWMDSLRQDEVLKEEELRNDKLDRELQKFKEGIFLNKNTSRDVRKNQF